MNSMCILCVWLQYALKTVPWSKINFATVSRWKVMPPTQLYTECRFPLSTGINWVVLEQRGNEFLRFKLSFFFLVCREIHGEPSVFDSSRPLENCAIESSLIYLLYMYVYLLDPLYSSIYLLQPFIYTHPFACTVSSYSSSNYSFTNYNYIQLCFHT